MTKQFTIDTKLKDVQIKDIQDGFAFNASLGNIIKWQLIGLYIQNDKAQIEELEKLFSTNGSLHDRRAYKTEAKAVYNAILSDEIGIVIDKKRLTIADLSNTPADDLNTSIGVLYKGLKKQPSKNKVDNSDKKAAKQALQSESINTDGINSPKQLMDIANGDSPFASIAKDAIEQAKLELIREDVTKGLPEVNSDNLERIRTMVQTLMGELHAEFPEEYSNIMLELMALDAVAPEQLAEAA